MALLAGVLGTAAPALGADTPFSARFAQTVRGSIDAVGNQLLTCPAAAAGCLNARNRAGAAGTMKLDGATKRRVYKLRARVAPSGGTLTVRPKAPRE